MKTAIYCSVLTLVSLWSLTSFGQGSCHNNNGGGYPNGGDQGYPYNPADPYGNGGSTYPGYPNQAPNTYPAGSQYGAGPYSNATPQIAAAIAAAAAAPKGPTARITVVSANSSAPALASLKSSSAKLTIVADEPIAEPKPIEVAVTEPAPVINEKIAGLVGTWKAVARQGDGELTTVELHLDNRGWAELTVPGSDGKPSTTKSRVNLENEELMLTAADKVVSLGKLVDFNTRQMVLERAEGRMTFVRL